MNARSSVAIGALTFVVGVAVGLGSGTQKAVASLLARSEPTPTVTAASAIGYSTVRGLLGIFIGKSKTFILTGVEDFQGRCNVAVTATGLQGDYMSVKAAQGPEFFVPYSAIFRIDREGPGPIGIPVVYTTAHPNPKFCGD